jgi:prolipoprotein diacylglyceryltransferase
MNRCDSCYNEWKARYIIAERRFDKAIAIAIAVTIISATMGLVAVILSALCVIRTQNFINQFEYVEETIVSQDGNGTNVAVIGDNTTFGKEE